MMHCVDVSACHMFKNLRDVNERIFSDVCSSETLCQSQVEHPIDVPAEHLLQSE